MDGSSAAPEPQPAAGAPPECPLGRQLLLGMASLALALALAEVLVRALGIGPVVAVVFAGSFVPSENPVLGYELSPGSADGSTTINLAGFRDREFPLEKPDGVFRIAAIGDSVTFGYDVSRDESYPKQLERLLNAAARPGAPRYEVLNFGVSGYNVPQIAERLRSLALRYEPDLVLYGYSLNDPQEFSFEAAMLERARERGQQALEPEGRGWRGRLLAHSRLYLLVHVLVLESSDYSGVESEPPDDPGVLASSRGRRDPYFRGLHRRPEALARLERGFGEVVEAASAHGAKALLAIFPVYAEEQPYPLSDVHRRVEALARAGGFEVVDLQPAFEAARRRREGALHGDLMHPTPLGHRVAADALLREVAARQPNALEPARAVGPGR